MAGKEGAGQEAIQSMITMLKGTQGAKATLIPSDIRSLVWILEDYNELLNRLNGHFPPAKPMTKVAHPGSS